MLEELLFVSLPEKPSYSEMKSEEAYGKYT